VPTAPGVSASWRSFTKLSSMISTLVYILGLGVSCNDIPICPASQIVLSLSSPTTAYLAAWGARGGVPDSWRVTHDGQLPGRLARVACVHWGSSGSSNTSSNSSTTITGRHAGS
jgi:hypothetical protein